MTCNRGLDAQGHLDPCGMSPNHFAFGYPVLKDEEIGTSSQRVC